MSLVGNLEDLSLPDILQIVSLSKKSGILMLEREGQQGKILIREGRVIQTVSPRPGRTLGELLTSRGLVGGADLRKALEIQRAGNNRELLGSILIELGLMDEASLEKIVQEQIEDAIVYFLSWRDGTFSFELADIKSRGEFSVDPQAFILERGIDTQWLVLEGTRLIDERARERGDAPDAEAQAGPAGETSFADLDTGAEAAPEETGAPLVLVEDDAVFREMAAAQLGRLGFRVFACDSVASGLREVERAAARGAAFAVVTDIVLPTLDGQGFLGGLELIEKLRLPHPGVPIVAVTAYPDENVRERVLELGGQFLAKPSSPAGAGEFFAAMARACGDAAGQGAAGAPAAAAPAPAPPPASAPAPAARPATPAPAPARAQAASARPASPVVAAPAAPTVRAGEAATPAASQVADELAAARVALEQQQRTVAAAALGREEEALLRDMLRELHGPRATSELGLLVLRFAAELLNRAVLFVVKGGSAVGLGGFGVEVPGGPERQGVRGIAIPLDQPSILSEVVSRRAPVQGPPGQSRWDRELLDQLGGKTPLEAVALPLVSGGKVRVILYGDNLPEQRPLASVRALEVFLAQAGQALEKVLQERKLQGAARP